jgi:heptosyltransferase-3
MVVDLGPDKTAAFKDIKKVLVIKFRHIGDVLLTSPAINALKENFPDADISVLVNSGTEEVLSGNPAITELMVYERKIKGLPALKKYMKEIAFFKEIREKGFDMAVDLTGGDRAAIVSFISGARYRLALDPGRQGFAGKRYLYTHLARIDSRKHMVLQNIDIIGQFGISTDNTDVDFSIPEEVKLSVREIFRSNNITGDDTIVHIHPTSRWMWKCWDDEYMAEIFSWMINKGMKVVLTSAPVDKEIETADRILSHIPDDLVSKGIVNLCGRTSIKELAAISDAADLFFGVDSAPMHIAAAVRTPVIALFGPTNEKVWGPFGKGHIVLSKEFECKPCRKGMCEGVQLRECMSAIKPDDVRAAVEKILNT